MNKKSQKIEQIIDSLDQIITSLLEVDDLKIAEHTNLLCKTKQLLIESLEREEHESNRGLDYFALAREVLGC